MKWFIVVAKDCGFDSNKGDHDQLKVDHCIGTPMEQ